MVVVKHSPGPTKVARARPRQPRRTSGRTGQKKHPGG